MADVFFFVKVFCACFVVDGFVDVCMFTIGCRSLFVSLLHLLLVEL